MNYLASFVPAASLALLCASSGTAVAQTNAPVADAAQPASMVYFGVRMLRDTPGDPIAWDAVMPPDCPTCVIDKSVTASGQNSLEIYFHIRAPNDRAVLRNIRVRVPSQSIRRVLISRTEGTYSQTAHLRGTRDAIFHKDDTGVGFDIPYEIVDPTLPSHDLGDVTGQYTYIQTPGVDVRIEHARSERVNGPYRDIPWPAVQRQAALNLQFAARDAIVLLGLDRAFIDRRIGTVILSGFDTNYPTSGPKSAHPDFPPHWHMQLAWDEGDRFRRVGHKYIDSQGLLEKNIVSVHDDRATPPNYNIPLGRGEVDITRDPQGRLIYSHRITPEGYFELGGETGTCRFMPVGKTFASGIDLDCGPLGKANGIRAEDDPEHGELRLFRSGTLAERHLYDKDSAKLMSSEIVGSLSVRGTR